MKRAFIFFLILASFPGCKDFLQEDPKGAIVGTNALNSVEGLDAALTGTYKGLLRTWSRGFFTSSIQAFVMGGDDLTTLSGGNKSSLRQEDQLNVTSGNGHIAAIWNGCFKTIQGANNIIANYQKVPGDKTKIDQIVGEAYFLRGLCYYWLVRGFDAVPLITSADYSADLLSIKKSSPAEIYAQIESDLLKAEELVGDMKRDAGRPNKGSVKALMADVYLTEGGWPMKDASKYAMAAAKAKEVIDNKATYKFDTVSLDKLWSGNENGIGTSEEVMSFHASVSYEGSTNAASGASATPGEEGGWDDYFSEVTFYNNFPAGKRKDLTFHTVFHKKESNGSYTAIPWQNSNAKHPYFAKFMKDTFNTAYESSMPVHILRYAHVLLIYAEAQARSTGSPSADAYTAVNTIRKRAGLTPLAVGLSGADFASAVVQERAWEFAAEYTRWFDLVRLEMVEEANSHKDVEDLKPEGPISKDDYQFPVPLTDANINPNLNAGG